MLMVGQTARLAGVRKTTTLSGPRELQDALYDRPADAEPADNDVRGM
jgi:hypothetical protein